MLPMQTANRWQPNTAPQKKINHGKSIKLFILTYEVQEYILCQNKQNNSARWQFWTPIFSVVSNCNKGRWHFLHLPTCSHFTLALCFLCSFLPFYCGQSKMGDSPQTAGNEPCEGLLLGEGREGGGGRCPSSPASSGGEPGGSHGEGCSSSPPVSCPCLSWSRLTDAINDWILPVLSQGLKKGRRNLMLFPHLCKATASAVCGQHSMNEGVCVWLWRLFLLHAEGRIVQSYVEKYFTFLLA